MKSLYIIFVITLITFSCTKHAGDYEEETPQAILVITQPTTGQVISKTDSIHITGSATAPVTMHGYDVYLTKPNDSTRLLSTTVHDHNTTLYINTRMAPQASGNYEAHVLLKLDHDGHILHKSVNFKIE
jgi:hypothetical protein